MRFLTVRQEVKQLRKELELLKAKKVLLQEQARILRGLAEDAGFIKDKLHESADNVEGVFADE